MKITREQLKQIIKEELGDWTPEMQRRARHSPMIAAVTGPGEPPTRASRERAADWSDGSHGAAVASRLLQDIKAAYAKLRIKEDKEIFEQNLDTGLQGLALTWRQGREEGY